jgi:hypothetical protein
MKKVYLSSKGVSAAISTKGAALIGLSVNKFDLIEQTLEKDYMLEKFLHLGQIE